MPSSPDRTETGQSFASITTTAPNIIDDRLTRTPDRENGTHDGDDATIVEPLTAHVRKMMERATSEHVSYIQETIAPRDTGRLDPARDLSLALLKGYEDGPRASMEPERSAAIGTAQELGIMLPSFVGEDPGAVNLRFATGPQIAARDAWSDLPRNNEGAGEMTPAKRFEESIILNSVLGFDAPFDTPETLSIGDHLFGRLAAQADTGDGVTLEDAEWNKPGELDEHGVPWTLSRCHTNLRRLTHNAIYLPASTASGVTSG